MYEDQDNDDEYNDDYHDYDNFKQDYAKHWFKFDPSIWKWLYDAANDVFETSPNVWITNIPGFKNVSIPVNSFSPIAGSPSAFQYIGVNFHGDGIWKKKHFVCDKLAIEYINHLRQHAVHFVQQPTYYKGLFDIQN